MLIRSLLMFTVFFSAFAVFQSGDALADLPSDKNVASKTKPGATEVAVSGAPGHRLDSYYSCMSGCSHGGSDSMMCDKFCRSLIPKLGELGDTKKLVATKCPNQTGRELALCLRQAAMPTDDRTKTVELKTPETGSGGAAR